MIVAASAAFSLSIFVSTTWKATPDSSSIANVSTSMGLMPWRESINANVRLSVGRPRR